MTTVVKNIRPEIKAFEYLNQEEPYGWEEVLRDFVNNKVLSFKNKRKTIYYTYASEGTVYYWDYDKGILLYLNTFGDRSESFLSFKQLSEQAFFKVVQLY